MVAEQRARLVDAALGDQPADARAADDEVLVADRVDLLGAEAVARAERCAAPRRCRRGRGRTGSSRRPRPRRRAAIRPARCARTSRDPSCDSSRVKRTTATPCMPARAERLELLLRRHQQRRRLVGAEDARRMRIEGHRGGRAAALARAPPHAVDDLHVPAVQAVEVPEREHRVGPARRRVVGEVGDVHRARAAPGPITRLSSLDHQAIIGERHARRQAGVGRRRAADRGTCA